MARWVLALVVSGLLFGGAGIALGRASERVTPTPRAAAEECAVVTLPEPSTAPRSAPEAAVSDAPSSAAIAEPAPSPGAPRVRRLVVTSGIEGHEPTEVLDEVRLGSGPVYAFVDASNAGAETTLTVTFEADDASRSTGHVELALPAHARRHRTWAYTRGIRHEGLWYAVVRDEHGTELAREAFEVIAPE